jgi:hypothetical protein
MKRFEDTKGIIKIRKSKKDRQLNGKEKKDRQLNGKEKKDRQLNGKEKTDKEEKQQSTKHYTEN